MDLDRFCPKSPRTLALQLTLHRGAAHEGVDVGVGLDPEVLLPPHELLEKLEPRPHPLAPRREIQRLPHRELADVVVVLAHVRSRTLRDEL